MNSQRNHGERNSYLPGNHDIPLLGNKNSKIPHINLRKKNYKLNLGHSTAHCFSFLYCLVLSKQFCEIKISSQNFSFYRRGTNTYIWWPLVLCHAFSVSSSSSSQMRIFSPSLPPPQSPIFAWLLPILSALSAACFLPTHPECWDTGVAFLSLIRTKKA